MLVYAVNNLVEFDADHMNRKVFYDSDKVRVMMLCVEKGLELKPHVLEHADGWTYIIEGRAIMTINDEQQEVKAGDLIIAPAKVKRGFKALERVIAIGGAAPLIGLPEVKAGELVFNK